jgi:hypothetical protein
VHEEHEGDDADEQPPCEREPAPRRAKKRHAEERSEGLLPPTALARDEEGARYNPWAESKLKSPIPFCIGVDYDPSNIERHLHPTHATAHPRIDRDRGEPDERLPQ